MTEGEVIVDLQHVSFRYSESDGFVEDINLQIRRGERVLLLGKNGSGKSTILSLIGGRRMARTGSVTVLNTDAFNDTRLNFSVSLIGIPWPPEAYFNTTVKSVASPAEDLQRRGMIARRLHLPLNADIDKMSAGEKRRVQVLHGMLRPPEVLLLDECSTEIDIAERRNVLRLAEDETKRGACCVYATHILDGVEDWATRVIVVERGRIVRDEPYSASLASNKRLAHNWLSKAPFTPFPTTAYPFPADPQGDEIAAMGDNLSFKSIFDNCNFKIPRGSRTLLVGCNGAGKTTLLKLMGGKTFFGNKNAELTVHGHRCYHEVKVLNELMSYGGDWWVKVPGGELHVGEMIPCPLTQFAESVRSALNVDLAWDVRYVSAGERKRIQLLLALAEPSPVILLDEATADLDLDMRHILLHFLHRASVQRGVTVIYATHIFEGLENWATDCLVIDRSKKGVHQHLKGDFDLSSVMTTLYELKDAETWYVDEPDDA